LTSWYYLNCKTKEARRFLKQRGGDNKEVKR
jgi:hypothetical protein